MRQGGYFAGKVARVVDKFSNVWVKFPNEKKEHWWPVAVVLPWMPAGAFAAMPAAFAAVAAAAAAKNAADDEPAAIIAAAEPTPPPSPTLTALAAAATLAAAVLTATPEPAAPEPATVVATPEPAAAAPVPVVNEQQPLAAGSRPQRERKAVETFVAGPSKRPKSHALQATADEDGWTPCSMPTARA